MTVPRSRVRSLSVRQRAALRLVTFSNRIGTSVAAMKRSHELGVEAPDEPDVTEGGHTGAGVPLDWTTP